MQDLRTINIPVISDSVTLELLCRDLKRNSRAYDPVSLHGRKGQSQDGVDVYGRSIESGEWFGIQCKVRNPNNRLTEVEIRAEIKMAFEFNPRLSEYSIWTTFPRDRELQELERTLIEELNSRQDMNFSIMFWEDIEEELKTEENINVYLRYYQSFFVDNTSLGQAVCNLMRVDLGIGESTDSGYELAIGKIPHYKDSKSSGIDYYRGCYLLLNFSDMKMEVFNPVVHDSDLERAIPNELDRIRIVGWLNTIDDLDDLIYSDVRSDKFLMTEDSWKQHIEQSREEDEET